MRSGTFVRYAELLGGHLDGLWVTHPAWGDIKAPVPPQWDLDDPFVTTVSYTATGRYAFREDGEPAEIFVLVRRGH